MSSKLVISSRTKIFASWSIFLSSRRCVLDCIHLVFTRTGVRCLLNRVCIWYLNVPHEIMSRYNSSTGLDPWFSVKSWGCVMMLATAAQANVYGNT